MVNAIIGALVQGGDVVPAASVRYLLSHLSRETLISLYNDALAYDYETISRRVVRAESRDIIGTLIS